MNSHITPEPLLLELSVSGRRASTLPVIPLYNDEEPPAHLLRTANDLQLPEVDELTLVRHFTRLSQLNHSIDTQFYPLGSCTMKYNPKVNDSAAALPGFRDSHPLLPPEQCQGSLRILYEVQENLQTLTGFAACSLQPAAGAQGELAGVLMIKALHRDRGDTKRTRMLIPDSAHGTNPATCAMAGYQTVTLASGPDGRISLRSLAEALDDTVAGVMITNPNTLGLFETQIREICAMVHLAGGLVYGDGANMNAIAGIVSPAELGFDLMHLNLHKTFSTPHGGGGPGACAILANYDLAPYLPGTPVIHTKTSPLYQAHRPEHSIGDIKSYAGNFGIIVRAWTYLRMLGAPGLRHVAEGAVLSANYLRVLLAEHWPAVHQRICMHEFVVQPPPGGIHTIDIAKRLLDYGFHPPTVYFPLIVSEAMMIEPTETETRQTLESFAAALNAIAAEIAENPALLTSSPHSTPVGRLDETAAARKPILCWC